MSYERHRMYNMQVRRVQRSKAKEDRLKREGKCIECEMILARDPEFPNHNCGNPYRREK